MVTDDERGIKASNRKAWGWQKEFGEDISLLWSNPQWVSEDTILSTNHSWSVIWALGPCNPYTITLPSAPKYQAPIIQSSFPSCSSSIHFYHFMPSTIQTPTPWILSPGFAHAQPCMPHVGPLAANPCIRSECFREV